MSDDVTRILREEMDARGLHNDVQRAALAAIIGGESNWTPKFETGWSHTDNKRIRAVFGERVADLSDDELNRIKASDEGFFDWVYGPKFHVGQMLGNTEPGDGYRFRGGGLLQITGRANYAKYGDRAGVDLVNHPELINTPRVAAATAVEYALDTFKGSNWSDLKRAVGVSIGGPDDTKNRLFGEYNDSGEWHYDPGRQPGTAPVEDDSLKIFDPIVTTFLEAAESLQGFLKKQRLYSGPVDRDIGPATRAALQAYMRRV
jgi:predicted chitinase